jgi:hypothetical protein
MSGQPVPAVTLQETLETTIQRLANMEGSLQQTSSLATLLANQVAAGATQTDPNALDVKALNRALKGDTLKFRGVQGDQAETHVRLLERRAEAAGVTNDVTCIRLFAHTFPPGSNADTWHQQMEKNEELPQEYAKYKKLFLKKWGPVDASGAFYRKLEHLKQTGSVEAYNNAFNNILEHCTVDPDHAIYLYTRGLKDTVGNDVYCHMGDDLSLVEVMNKASDLDARMAVRGMFKTNRYGGGAAAAAGSGPTPMDLGAVLPKHQKLDPLTNEQREELRHQGRCFRCRIGRHLAKDCPWKGDDAASVGQ